GSRAVNWQENAMRLYQLGVGADDDPVDELDGIADDILAIMPELPNRESYSATPFEVASPVGDIIGSDLTLVYRSDTGATERTSVVKAVRY
ncbi:MAG: hypothetical protein ACKVHP_26170, partial [Verrucomicrobiales bacterium]